MNYKALFLSLALVAGTGLAWSQTMPGGGGGGLPQPVVNGECLIGSGGVAIWGSCSGAGTSVTSVTNADGTLTTSPTTGAVVPSLNLAHANTWTAIQTFTNSDLKLLGSSTGATTFTSANAGASNFTLTFPAITDTVDTLTETSTLTNKTLTSPAITSPTVTGSFTATGLVTNADLANSSMTLAGTSVSLGGTLTESAMLDSLGSTQGDILYRSATGWTILAPGTSGNCLQTQGAAANPMWAGCGSGGSPTITQGNGVSVSTSGSACSSCTIASTVTLATKTTSYAIQATDGGSLLDFNGSSVAPTLPVSSTSGYGSGFGIDLQNINASALTLTATTSTFDNGATTLSLALGQHALVWGDGTNYHSMVTLPVVATNTILGNSSGSSNYPTSQAVGTGVLTALGNNLSAAGGVTSTIASGTSAMGTGAISSATCATVVTTSAPNTATTDVVLASFNGDPTAVTGYIPSTTGMLTIISYPTSGNVNFKVCNNTSGSITPGAITLNWRVVR